MDNYEKMVFQKLLDRARETVQTNQYNDYTFDEINESLVKEAERLLKKRE